MSAKVKNIIIILVAALVLVLLYVFFLKPKPEEENLVSLNEEIPVSEMETTNTGDDFLSVLLNIKSIKLDDSIFSNEAFLNLKDSSINLVQEGNEGRLNPFAPIGQDTILPITTNPVIDTSPNISPVPTNPVTPATPNTPSTPTTPTTGNSTNQKVN